MQDTPATRLAALTALDLRRLRSISGAFSLSAILSLLPNLCSLGVADMDLSDDAMRALPSDLSAVPHLTRLDVSGNDCDESMFAHLQGVNVILQDDQ